MLQSFHDRWASNYLDQAIDDNLLAKHHTITSQLPEPLIRCNTIQDMKRVMMHWEKRSYSSLVNPRTQLEESMPDAAEIVSPDFQVRIYSAQYNGLLVPFFFSFPYLSDL